LRWFEALELSQLLKEVLPSKASGLIGSTQNMKIPMG